MHDLMQFSANTIISFHTQKDPFLKDVSSYYQIENLDFEKR